MMQGNKLIEMTAAEAIAWPLKETKSYRCKHGVLPSKRCCNVCKELDNILYKCNQEIIKQTCKAEQLEQQLAAAKAELAAEREKREIGPANYGGLTNEKY